MEPKVFFTESRRKVEVAKAICAGCPVQADCFEDTLEMPEHLQEYGVRAGMTPLELKAYKLALEHISTLEQEKETA